MIWVTVDRNTEVEMVGMSIKFKYITLSKSPTNDQTILISQPEAEIEGKI
jgi:uncharacterized pyridoxamine 5'-phosphate oxidase family protein